MPEPKIYLKKVSAKEVQTQWGAVLKLGVHADTMIDFLNQHRNEKGYVNIAISPRKEVGQYGDTHSVTLDTWKPGQRRNAPARQPAPEPPTQSAQPGDDSDSVPF